MLSRQILAGFSLIILQSLLHLYADAGYIDFLGCDDAEKLHISKALSNTGILLERAAVRLDSLYTILWSPSALKAGDPPQVINPPDLDPLNASTLQTYDAYMDSSVEKVLASTDKQLRHELMGRISFYARLAAQLRRGVTKVTRLSAPGQAQSGNARPIQISCGDRWLQSLQQLRNIAALDEEQEYADVSAMPIEGFADRRPGRSIATSEKGHRQTINIQERTGYVGVPELRINDDSHIITGHKPFEAPNEYSVVTINGLAGPYQSVIVIGRQLFADWTVDKPLDDPDFLQMEQYCAGEPCPDHKWHSQNWFKYHTELALVLGAALSPSLALGGDAYDATGGGAGWEFRRENDAVIRDDLGRLLFPLRPLEKAPGNEPTTIISWLLATIRAHRDPDAASISVENFMYLVISLGLKQFDWSTGWNRKLESAKTPFGRMPIYPPSDPLMLDQRKQIVPNGPQRSDEETNGAKKGNSVKKGNGIKKGNIVKGSSGVKGGNGVKKGLGAKEGSGIKKGNGVKGGNSGKKGNGAEDVNIAKDGNDAEDVNGVKGDNGANEDNGVNKGTGAGEDNGEAS